MERKRAIEQAKEILKLGRSGIIGETDIEALSLLISIAERLDKEKIDEIVRKQPRWKIHDTPRTIKITNVGER